MKSVSLKSPAKLNLLLKVIKKRKDGYHNIVTLFERIDLCDDIRLRSNRIGKIRIFCNDPKVPRGPKNLAYKAAKLIQDEFSLKNGVDIRITKRIPVAAGLAGGSSNAATVLLGLNKIWKLSLTKNELLRYAKVIGSDVPLFLYNCSWAVGKERGDAIKKLFLRRKLWHILVVPELKVYSREAFGAFKLQLTKVGYNVNILIHALRKNDLLKVGSLLSNDLEAVVQKLYPSLLRLKERLLILRAKGVVLSGSGPAMFAVTGSKREAEAFKVQLRKYYKRVFVVSTL